MIPERLSRRKIRIKAKPLADRAQAFGGVQRREPTQIDSPEPDGAAAFEDFFEFEKQLAGMEPARETFSATQEEPQEEQEMIFEDAPPIIQVPSTSKRVESKEEGTGFIVLEEIPSSISEEEQKEFQFDFKPVGTPSSPIPVPANLSVSPSSAKEEKQETLYSKSIGFEFVQCSYQMISGAQCKRQAPKGSSICSIHMKVINRKGKTSAI